jgi:hypothetical protein
MPVYVVAPRRNFALQELHKKESIYVEVLHSIQKHYEVPIKKLERSVHSPQRTVRIASIPTAVGLAFSLRTG